MPWQPTTIRRPDRLVSWSSRHGQAYYFGTGGQAPFLPRGHQRDQHSVEMTSQCPHTQCPGGRRQASCPCHAPRWRRTSPHRAETTNTANVANTANGAFALPPQICEALLYIDETQYAGSNASSILDRRPRTADRGLPARRPVRRPVRRLVRRLVRRSSERGRKLRAKAEAPGEGGSSERRRKLRAKAEAPSEGGSLGAGGPAAP